MGGMAGSRSAVRSSVRDREYGKKIKELHLQLFLLVKICRTITSSKPVKIWYYHFRCYLRHGRRLATIAITAVMVKKPNRIIGGGSISTYEMFTIILGTAMLIVAILNMDRKK